ncbi:HAD family hydrolase [Microbulbifer sp. ALW1]|uniref:P-type ATPase n=1 Tax=Microbulbifer sp. (strain ALW1) TaxID=1516059 RepID=UPI00210211A0|nr:HAD family hydrolase [Microbulbifer sp. ALW1]
MPIARLADTISAIFVPSVMIIAVVAALVWYNLGPDPKVAHMLVVLTSVLIIACPCALGLATPMSVMVGVARARKMACWCATARPCSRPRGWITLVVDKTGTLTEGAPKLTDIESDSDTDTLLQQLASLESRSEHPLAEAIVSAAKEKNLSLSEVTGFEAITAHGVSGDVDGKKVLLGNRN